MSYKNLFIDLDDTLWDTYHNNQACLKEVYEDYHFNQYYTSFEEFFKVYWLYNNELWAKYRNNEIDRQTLIVERFRKFLIPLGLDSIDDVLKLNKDFLHRTTRKTGLVEGALELLDYLQSKQYNLFILSNGFREVQSTKMENSGLSPYFKRLILSEDAAIQKPNKGIFDYALINTNSKREESLMIGDSWEADIAGAYHSKIDQLWFNPYGFPCEGFQPTYMVHSLLEIKELL